MSINKVILVGNVGKDPTVRYFDKGVAKVNFPLATSETYTNQQGETITSTEWHNIVLWRALAEVAEKTVKKGSQVYIVGKIKTRSYVDKDGVNKYITEILADTFLLLEKKQTAFTSPGQPEANRSEISGKATSGTEVNEPSSSYKAVNDNININRTINGTTGSDDNDYNDFGKNIPGISQNEDDLPF
jgi:single-strand DNA-binding protein